MQANHGLHATNGGSDRDWPESLRRPVTGCTSPVEVLTQASHGLPQRQGHSKAPLNAAGFNSRRGRNPSRNAQEAGSGLWQHLLLLFRLPLCGLLHGCGIAKGLQSKVHLGRTNRAEACTHAAVGKEGVPSQGSSRASMQSSEAIRDSFESPRTRWGGVHAHAHTETASLDMHRLSNAVHGPLLHCLLSNSFLAQLGSIPPQATHAHCAARPGPHSPGGLRLRHHPAAARSHQTCRTRGCGTRGCGTRGRGTRGRESFTSGSRCDLQHQALGAPSTVPHARRSHHSGTRACLSADAQA